MLPSVVLIVTWPLFTHCMKKIADSRKPPDVIAKIVSGRMKKFYQSACLTEQEHMVEDGNPTVSKALADLGLRVTRFEKLSV
jgi:translation elongation factor EF-Ts